ncbi:hypothetical protein [Neobacillus piezotolerans]|uniref:hypothetical protein n=1 Tax=Neobacillus piezotolerans TaxID=2259171 RepID=UPI0015F14238|nr:hypothetical protein [Neobacillus piezotolerans]
MKFWSFIACLLIGFGVGLSLDNPAPGVIIGSGFGLIFIIVLSLLQKNKTIEN